MKVEFGTLVKKLIGNITPYTQPFVPQSPWVSIHKVPTFVVLIRTTGWKGQIEDGRVYDLDPYYFFLSMTK